MRAEQEIIPLDIYYCPWCAMAGKQVRIGTSGKGPPAGDCIYIRFKPCPICNRRADAGHYEAPGFR